MGLEMSKYYFYKFFYPISAKHNEDVGFYRGMQAISFLGKQLSFINFNIWAGVNGNCNCAIILKTSGRRVKQMNIWDS